jgi:TPR repeat protein
MSKFLLYKALINSLVAVTLLALPVSNAFSETIPEEIDLQEIVRNPVVGNYKGYAEFKMGHYDNAHTIWEALENKGNAQASFNLGILYEDGLGVLQDNQQAIVHYEKAAQAGSSKAQYRLGLLYSAGLKIPKDDIKADKWLAAAAAQGDDDAALLLAQRQLTQRKDSPTISKRDKEFFDAENRHAAGQYKEAAVIWQQLAKAGDTRSRTRLAWMYEAGQGMPRDLHQAATLFKQSAEEGDAEAQYALAVMLQTGKGQTQNTKAAQLWLQRAAAQDYGPAKEALTRNL